MSEIPHRASIQSTPRPSSAELLDLLDRTIESYAARGMLPGDLAPLYEVRQGLAAFAEPAPAPAATERRREDTEVSEIVLARACATMEFLVLGGSSIEKAAQTITRQLLATGLKLPEKGGDARGWRRMLEIHRSLSRGKASPAALEEYRRFRQQISSIPAPERMACMLGERLWDRRASGRASAPAS